MSCIVIESRPGARRHEPTMGTDSPDLFRRWVCVADRPRRKRHPDWAQRSVSDRSVCCAPGTRVAPWKTLSSGHSRGAPAGFRHG